jgi:tetratricopeptide (TPR) repeat protein
MTKKILGMLLTFILAANIIFAQATEMNPEAAQLYNDGNKLVKSGQYQAALEKYNASLGIQDHQNTHYQKSVAYKKLRQYKEAEAALLKAIELDPNFMIAFSGLGTTYYSLKNYNKAIENFEKYISLSDDEKQNKRIKKYVGLAYTQLGQAAKSNGKHQVAIENFNNAVSNYDYDAAYLYLAEVHYEVGNYDLALEAADKAINFRGAKSKISKGAPYYYKGLAFKGKNELDKARENFNVSVKDKQYKNSSKYELDNMN